MRNGKIGSGLTERIGFGVLKTVEQFLKFLYLVCHLNYACSTDIFCLEAFSCIVAFEGNTGVS